MKGKARALPFRKYFGDMLGSFYLEEVVREIERNQRPHVLDVGKFSDPSHVNILGLVVCQFVLCDVQLLD